MWRALYRLYRIVSWLEHWILRRFTSAGLRSLSALIIAAMLGVDTSNLVAYEVFALLACVITMAVVFSWFFRAKFAATRLLPRFGTAGQAMSYRVVVQNLTGHDGEAAGGGGLVAPGRRVCGAGVRRPDRRLAGRACGHDPGGPSSQAAVRT